MFLLPWQTEIISCGIWTRIGKNEHETLLHQEASSGEIVSSQLSFTEGWEWHVDVSLFQDNNQEHFAYKVK